jgi:hypothetical protein
MSTIVKSFTFPARDVVPTNVSIRRPSEATVKAVQDELNAGTCLKVGSDDTVHCMHRENGTFACRVNMVPAEEDSGETCLIGPEFVMDKFPAVRQIVYATGAEYNPTAVGYLLEEGKPLYDCTKEGTVCQRHAAECAEDTSCGMRTEFMEGAIQMWSDAGGWYTKVSPNDLKVEHHNCYSDDVCADVYGDSRSVCENNNCTWQWQWE